MGRTKAAERPDMPADWAFDRDQQFQMKREVLLKTAASCFNQKGFGGTSLRDVADQLNITDAALYYYVRSKEELVFLCYQRALDLGEHAMRRAAQDGASGLEKLKFYIRYQMEAMCGNAGPVAVLSEIPSLKPAHRAHILERTRQDSRTVAGFVQAGIDDGSIRPCNPALTCSVIFGALNWVPKWYKFDGRHDAMDTAETFVKTLTEGIAR